MRPLWIQCIECFGRAWKEDNFPSNSKTFFHHDFTIQWPLANNVSYGCKIHSVNIYCSSINITLIYRALEGHNSLILSWKKNINIFNIFTINSKAADHITLWGRFIVSDSLLQCNWEVLPVSFFVSFWTTWPKFRGTHMVTPWGTVFSPTGNASRIHND